jgi:hypothetical protein
VVCETAFCQFVEVVLYTFKVSLMKQKGMFWHQIPGGNSAREFGNQLKRLIPKVLLTADGMTITD